MTTPLDKLIFKHDTLLQNASYKNLNWTRNWLKSVKCRVYSSDILHSTLYNVVELNLTQKEHLEIKKRKEKKNQVDETHFVRLYYTYIIVIVTTNKKNPLIMQMKISWKMGTMSLGINLFLNETALMQIALSLDVCMVIKYWFALWLYLESILYTY